MFLGQGMCIGGLMRLHVFQWCIHLDHATGIV